MAGQLDEHPAQTLRPTPEHTEPIESSSRRLTWIAATTAVAGLAIGAGLIVTVARTDTARSPVGNAEQDDTPTPGVSGNGLPWHLQELERRTTAGPSEGTDAAEYARMQRLAGENSFQAAEEARMQRLAGENSFEAAEEARMQRLADNSLDVAAVAAQASQEPQRSAYQLVQDEIDASLTRRDSASGQ